MTATAAELEREAQELAAYLEELAALDLEDLAAETGAAHRRAARFGAWWNLAAAVAAAYLGRRLELDLEPWTAAELEALAAWDLAALDLETGARPPWEAAPISAVPATVPPRGPDLLGTWAPGPRPAAAPAAAAAVPGPRLYLPDGHARTLAPAQAQELEAAARRHPSTTTTAAPAANKETPTP